MTKVCMIKTLVKKLSSAGCLLAVALAAFTPLFAESPHDAALKKVLSVDEKLHTTNDELVIYYVRGDADYEPWALWMWAIPGGDGNAMWPYTQNWRVEDGVAYMRFRLDGSDTGNAKPVSADGKVGLIVRRDDGWTKDGNDDRVWDIAASNKVVIFSGDQNTYAAAPDGIERVAALREAKKQDFERAAKLQPGDDVALGCTYTAGSATFRLWAPTAKTVRVNLYRTDRAQKPDYTVDMSMDEASGVWSASFDKANPDGFFYDYTLTRTGLASPVTVLDPYAKSMAAYRNDGTVGRGAVIDMTSERANPAGGMDGAYYPLAKREDAVIYEISVRDFTISPDAGVIAAPGTYKAFIEKIPYLKSLGITHVQLMPVVNFYNNNETDRAYDDRGVVNGSNYNWGYDPHNYFTPEGWYATDATDPYCRVRELRELVNECHKAGLGVLLDVVYNHMAGTQFLDDIVPGYYFRTNANGGFTGKSGCGNDTATERSMMARLVRDSTEHWVREYKVDGFRFDLMGLMEAQSVEKAYESCVRVNPHVLFEGEGWRMYNGEDGTVGMDQGYMRKTDHVAVFNDELRDLLKAGGFNEAGLGLITGKETNGADLFRSVLGNPKSYGVNQPGANIQYMTCHDGLTLHDAIAHNAQADESTAEGKAQIIRRAKMGNVLALTAQGIAFLHGGQERGRTKPNVNRARAECVGAFVRNSYDASDNINQFVWTLDADYQNLLDYTAGLIALRKSTDAFRLADAKRIKEQSVLLTGSDRSLVFAYRLKSGDGDWIVAVNASGKKASIKSDVPLKKAVVLADAVSAGVEPIAAPVGVTASGKKIALEPLTATIIQVK